MGKNSDVHAYINKRDMTGVSDRIRSFLLSPLLIQQPLSANFTESESTYYSIFSF